MPVKLFCTGLFTVPFASRLCHSGRHASFVFALSICAMAYLSATPQSD